MKKLLIKIKLWYKGYADFQNHINDSEHPRLVIIAYPPSLLRRIIVTIVNFWIEHWQWTIGIIIALGMFFVAVLSFIYTKK